MPVVGFTRDGGVCPCRFGFYSSTREVLELFGNDSIVLAQSLLRIATPCKTVREFQGKDASRMNSHAKPLPKANIFLSLKAWKVILSSGSVG